MKRRKYLSIRWWQFVFPMVILLGGGWFAEPFFPADHRLNQMFYYSIIGITGVFTFSFAWRTMSKSLKVEQKLKKGDILCIYCIYPLDTKVWPQRCPECGELQTYKEVFDYWDALSNTMEPNPPTD